MTAESNVHDLLVIPSNKKLYRFKADIAGFGEKPAVDFYDKEYRNVMNIAQPGTPTSLRGPAFAVIPNKPDPATAQICCFLINSENVRAGNPWTAAAWSSEPSAHMAGLELERNARDEEPLEFLAAGPDGRVFWIQNADGKLPCLELNIEAEVYTQLRNGLVAGSAFCVKAGRTLPLVNVTSLFPNDRSL